MIGINLKSAWRVREIALCRLLDRIATLLGFAGIVAECDYSTDDPPTKLSVRRTPLGVGITVNGQYFGFSRFRGELQDVGICGKIVNGTPVCNHGRACSLMLPTDLEETPDTGKRLV